MEEGTAIKIFISIIAVICLFSVIWTWYYSSQTDLTRLVKQLVRSTRRGQLVWSKTFSDAYDCKYEGFYIRITDGNMLQVTRINADTVTYKLCKDRVLYNTVHKYTVNNNAIAKDLFDKLQWRTTK